MTKTLSKYLHMDEDKAVKALLKALPWDEARASAVEENAQDIVKALRKQKMPMGQLEAFLKDYSLNTEEGIALMCLAEALLRVPDKATANSLIRDKVAAANWLEGAGDSKDWVVKAAGVGLFMTSKTLDGVMSRVGEPFIREAMVRAMAVLGKQFVLGTDIEDALQNAQKYRKGGYRMSYDILGEGARTMADADRYFESYAQAIRYTGERAAQDTGGSNSQGYGRPGVSVKLSALHPRYEFAQGARALPEMSERLIELAHLAQQHDIGLTVDAEEADRLEISLEIIETTLKELDHGWEGFGLAVQAYQKRALPLIDHLADLSKSHKKRLQVRLVKGAYWDTEIKIAQVEGLDTFPVYTRKSNTDVSYLACSHKLLSNADRFYPMLATHNAHSIAGVLDMAAELKVESYEFQRLYGMGQGMFDMLIKDHGLPVTIYAPVGPHKDLLPYLVRRLLENGANTSFVNRMLDPDASVEELVADPVSRVRERKVHGHPQIRLPIDLYHLEGETGRINSKGLDLSDPTSVDGLLGGMSKFTGEYEAAALIDGREYRESVPEPVENPADKDDVVGQVWPARKTLVNEVMRKSGESFVEWSGTDASIRAQILERIADVYEENRDELMALLVREAGKTIPDALGELREAVDFCRYYAGQGRVSFSRFGQEMIGPTGESNVLTLHGRGTFVCISPWNFPLAIFTGQIVAALMAGNCVVAKPAEQTALIAKMAVDLMHDAGVPEGALHLMPGDGLVGAALVEHPDAAGVAFTGSTEVAHSINRSLAAKDGAIVPLIAETGGQNCMIVDSSALPEQVIDDVILSAFGSAGQRCSALRILCIQDDVADKMIRMLKGAMQELRVGQPCDLATDIGPVIDEVAFSGLVNHREGLKGYGTYIHEVSFESSLRQKGHFFAPCAYEIPDLKGLSREVFGPILHVIRYKKSELEDLLAEIDGTGYGLTLGVHSRIDEFQDYIVSRIRAGNAYVNRSIIGAIVGSQPFGGHGLSGTGPKAGGPHYLQRFATERVVSIDTTATGGNASLVSLSE